MVASPISVKGIFLPRVDRKGNLFIFDANEPHLNLCFLSNNTKKGDVTPLGRSLKTVFELLICSPFFEGSAADTDPNGPLEHPRLLLPVISPSSCWPCACHRATQWPLCWWIWVRRNSPSWAKSPFWDICGPQASWYDNICIYICLQEMTHLLVYSLRSVLGLIDSSPELSLLSTALSLTELANKLTKVIFYLEKNDFDQFSVRYYNDIDELAGGTLDGVCSV